MPKYCECRISSPSAHHNCCINDGCGKEIKTIYEKYSELEQQLKEAERVIEFYGDIFNWFTPELHEFTCDESSITSQDIELPNQKGGKRARQYLAKYKTNE